MNSTNAFSVLLLLIISLPGTAGAQDLPEPYTVPGTVVHTLESEFIDEGFQVYVGFPQGFGSDPTARYPVLYALDADFAVGTMVEISRLLAFAGEATPLIVVGIGYEAGADFMTLRGRDFTPTPNPEYDANVSLEPGSGEAANLLAALKGEILPFIESLYPIEVGERGFFGDSFGGLFGLFTLFHEPGMFQRYILGSPSIWWDNGVTFAFEERFAEAHDDLAVKITLSVGMLEEDPDDPLSVEAAMVSNVRKMAERLRSRGYPSLELHTRYIDGETHISAVPTNFSWGLRVLFGADGG
jgi:predicted alpha/beta superfamily hydrolase